MSGSDEGILVLHTLDTVLDRFISRQALRICAQHDVESTVKSSSMALKLTCYMVTFDVQRILSP